MPEALVAGTRHQVDFAVYFRSNQTDLVILIAHANSKEGFSETVLISCTSRRAPDLVNKACGHLAQSGIKSHWRGFLGQQL
jgi:hypothetical protein